MQGVLPSPGTQKYPLGARSWLSAAWRWFPTRTAPPRFSSQPHRDVARRPPAVAAGRDQTLFLHPAGKVTALPCAPRPVAPSGPVWWDTLYLNPTRNMSVPDGRRQKKCWFNFCSKCQRSPFTDLLARRCRASLDAPDVGFCTLWVATAHFGDAFSLLPRLRA